MLGDWYANLYIARPQQLIVCMNSRTLAVVIVPARDAAKTLGTRFRIAVENYLRRLDVPAAAIEAEMLEMAELSIGPTASRSILGCLREAEYVLSVLLSEGKPLEEIELILSEFIYSTTRYRQPRELVHELFAQAATSTE